MRHGSPSDYTPLDPSLSRYDHAIGTLSVEGELRGHLACVVGRISFPSPAPWLWFVVVWKDGSKERPFEDYGPAWWTIRELDAGRFEHHGPTSRAHNRFLWWRVGGTKPGSPMTFEFEWVPAQRAQATWNDLGLTEADF